MAGAFLRVACDDCGAEQIVFERASTEVVCHGCGTTLSRPTGGKATLSASVVETVEAR